jgi:hypothetical protein
MCKNLFLGLFKVLLIQVKIGGDGLCLGNFRMNVE